MKLLRTILGVIAGYAVLVLLTFGTLTLAWLILDARGAFEAGSWEPSETWLIVMGAAGLVTAVVGGITAALVGGRQAVIGLVAVVVVLGLLTAVAQVMTPLPDGGLPPRPEDVPMFEAMQNARQPAAFAFALPVIGAIGTLVGGAIIGRASKTPRR